MPKIEPTWIKQQPFRNLTQERFEELTDIEKSYYMRGHVVPAPERKKVYACYVDGGCFGNGKQDATAYGSYKIFDVTDLVYYPQKDSPEGILPSHVHQMLQDPRSGPVEENLRFDLAVDPKKKATNNYAEVLSMQMVLMTLNSLDYVHPDNYVFVFSDSQLVVNQLLGTFAVRNKQLSDVYTQIKQNLSKYHKRHKESVWKSLEVDQIPGTLMKKLLGH